MDKIEKLNKPVLRWLLFLPAGIIAYFIFSFVQYITLYIAIGFIFSNTLIYSYILFFIREFSSVYIAIAVSILIVPKGKILVASIILGIYLIFFGFAIFFIMQDNSQAKSIIWASVLNVSACILILILLIKNRLIL